MNKLTTLAATIVATIGALTSCNASDKSDGAGELSLKKAVGDRFLVGVALNSRQIIGEDSAGIDVVKQHFNSIVAENCMKNESIHPYQDVYNFGCADSLVTFGEENGMAVIGHCLVWHSQLAKWFLYDEKGDTVCADTLKARMKDHIYTVVGRYKGKIHGWDVVNEAFLEDGSYRKSPFYNIIGEEYIPLAFQWAHEADPDAELYYNDYGMDGEKKREAVVKLVRSLKERGLRIDAVGMQSHVGMDYPDLKEYEKSMLAFAAEGVNVMVTEWEMSALPTIHRGANISDLANYSDKFNPYPTGLPEEVSEAWNKRMDKFFQLYLKHSDIITRVTAWGVSDGDSWKNDYPMKGRIDYPLLFDRNHVPKQFIKDFCSKANTSKE